MKRSNLARESLDAESRSKLEELIAEHDPMGRLLTWARRTRREQTAAQATSRSATLSGKWNASTRTSARKNDLRLPAVGSILTRTYQGRELAVRILGESFEFEGRRYRSLSAIAKAVTGSHWNGYLFFGITRQEK